MNSNQMWKGGMMKRFLAEVCPRRRRRRHSLLHSGIAGSQKSRPSPEQALLIHCSAQNFQTVRYVLSITAFGVRIYGSGRRLNSFKVSCILFQTIPVVDSNGGILVVISLY